MKTYLSEIQYSMKVLSLKKNSIFLGQSVKYPGSSIYQSLINIPSRKKLELPVFEDTQMGMSIGMALTGQRVVSIFPRWNFLICATNQLVSVSEDSSKF